MVKHHRNKYKVSPAAERTFNGRTYDSKAECLYAQQLDLMLQSGDVLDVVEQPRVTLGVPENVYRPDFLIIPDGELPYYVDVKGMETPKFKKDKKLWKAYGRLDLYIVKQSGKRFKTTEVIQVIERAA